MTKSAQKSGTPTLRDVALAAGVTLATASRSMTGAYGVHPDTRQRVLAAAATIRYKPNRFARALVTGRSNLIGLIVSDIRNSYFAELARGAEDTAYAAGRDLVLCNSDMDPKKQMRYIDSLLERRVEGIVMNSAMNLSRKEQDVLAESRMPVVLLYRPKEKTRFSTVSTDGERGGELAAAHLLANGHRQMAFLSGPRQHANLSRRAAGFLEHIRKCGQGASVLMIHGTHSLAGGYEMATALFHKPKGITAIATANDALALGVLKAAIELRVRIPRDVSLIGFDDLEIASLVNPPLTTIRQPKYEIGAAAVEILLHLSANEERLPEHRVFGVELVERDSVRNLGRTR